MMPGGTQRAQAKMQAILVKNNFFTVCVVEPHDWQGCVESLSLEILKS